MILIMRKMILILLFLLDFWLSIANMKNVKHLKELNEELMPVAWHPKRWWNSCMPEGEKKKQNQFLQSNAFSVC